ncbi:MAG: hypothetical protein A3B74_04425 [Candidatus Kerfeldbacteria bacterium RIFCSPHIGHO2_02_FULL_42_14]|uniref:Sigma-54 factor interaction domain-containing protein n=1 Tax=Candidatus Kerfeldbacteria bacterium RIFCSPHIGHO2_02_FULL_42_14 TaxID=1798540 RepID=A0A1G2APW6_9BACT|nr:MAG: hypothetical protein A3B74_04425 [Candidatus Kerfeldbacteria bacterium RIFCSPHIGHO2_02_FULL_42_14]
MEAQSKKTNVHFFACPTCVGYGFLVTPAGKPITCSQCVGKESLVGILGGKILYWDRPIDQLVIFEEKIIRTVKYARIGILTTLLTFGILMFLLEFWNIVQEGESFTFLITRRSPLLLIFYLTLPIFFYLLFVYYRGKTVSHPIPWRKTERDEVIAQENFEGATYNTLKNNKKTKLNVSSFVNEEVYKILEHAFQYAESMRHQTVEPLHVLAVLLPTTKLRLIFGRLGIPPVEFHKRVETLLEKFSDKKFQQALPGHKWYKMLMVAYEEAFVGERDQIQPQDLLFALVKVDKKIQDIFYDLGVDLTKLHHVSEWVHAQKQLAENVRRWQREALLKPKNTMNRALTARPTRVLDSMSQDLTLMARTGSFFPLINRKEELAATFRALKEVGGSVLFVGNSGTGKSAVIYGLAERMAAEEVPEQLKDRRLVAMNIGALLAGAAGVGVAEERMLAAIKEITLASNVILVIEDIDTLFSGAMGAAVESAQILTDFIGQGLMKVVATARTEEYLRFLQDKGSFLRRFKKIVVEEPNFDLTMRILQSRAGIFEYRYKAYYSYDALEQTILLTTRYFHERYLPEKALDVIEQAAIYAAEKRGAKTIVTKADVAEIIAQHTNIPVKEITAEESEKLLMLEEQIHERLIDQEEAVRSVASALRRAREELRDITRPIANLLFLGPTGVGKTELAKTVAALYFGDEKKMVRLDMSEYQDQLSIYRMIGSPTGSQSGGVGGYLTEAIRHSPFAVLLLDEIEKAHPDILNIFLQVMDDGRLTDTLGRTIDFTHTIIIATSNAVAQMIHDSVRQEMPMEKIKEQLIEGEIPKYFRPEFINRFDNVIVFKPLSEEDIFAIAKLLLKRVARDLENKGIFFSTSEDAVRELAEKGFDPKFGARPLRRVIQNHVDDALAKLLLKGTLGRRDQVILEVGGRIRVEKAEQLVT